MRSLLMILLGILLILFPAAAVDGSAVFMVRGITVQDNTIFISNGTAVNLSYRPDHTEDIAAINPGLTYVKTLPDGWSEPVSLPAGEYTAYLRQGNADQPEIQQFVIGEGITRVVFMGAAYSSGDEGCCSCRNVTVVDVPGQVIHHPETTVTVHHEEESHKEWRYAMGQFHIISTKWYEKVGKWKVKCSNPNHVTSYHIETEGCTAVIWSAWVTTVVLGYEKEERIIVTKPAYDGIMIIPAWDEQVGAITHEETVCGQKLVCPCGCVRRGERE